MHLGYIGCFILKLLQKSASDVGNFDTDFTKEHARLTAPDKDLIKTMNQNLFDGFSFTNMAMVRN